MIPLRALLTRNYTPVMTLVIIGLNVFCFFIELTQPRVVDSYALIPDRFHLTALVTSMFLHGGWLHLIGNMWFLWVFGSHIENALGSARFLFMYLLCGVLSAVVQLAMNLGSPIPTLGASGAIAGVMGAFLVLYPRVRVLTLVLIIFFITTFDIPAAYMLAYWFVIQLVSGLFSAGHFSDAGGVAWFAHVGGFLAGIFLVRLFPITRRRYYYS